MMDIKKSGCKFEICKLKNVRKNALDFYITSKVAEILTVDPYANIAIISLDKDFKSVLDYWRPRLVMTYQMILCKRIATAFMYIKGDSIRKKMADDRMSVMDLQTEYIKYQERWKIIDKISSVFKGTEYEELVVQIVDIIIASDGPKVLYLNSLKSFGKEKGIEVYKRIKKSSINCVI